MVSFLSDADLKQSFSFGYPCFTEPSSPCSKLLRPLLQAPRASRASPIARRNSRTSAVSLQASRSDAGWTGWCWDPSSHIPELPNSMEQLGQPQLKMAIWFTGGAPQFSSCTGFFPKHRHRKYRKQTLSMRSSSKPRFSRKRGGCCDRERNQSVSGPQINSGTVSKTC